MDHQYPKYKYHLTKKAVIVKDPDAEGALGIGWANTEGPFEPYRGPRPARCGPQACLRWVDEWPIPNLSPDLGKRIKSQFLKADALFWKSPDDPATLEGCMQRAFAGVAEVLWDAGIVSESLLENEIPALVWDTAVAAGWWRYASETLTDISAQKVGHYWVWWDDSRDWQGVFRGVTAECLARLLDAQSQSARTGLTPADRKPRPAQGTALDNDRINRWMLEESYDNQELADRLRCSLRTVHSMRKNQRYHGRKAIAKLANLMQVEVADLCRPVK
jgi:hypothetical protein